jgi:hypothetical protein
MELAGSSKTLVSFYQIIRHHIPEDSTLNKLERILTMVYVVQNSQNFSGLFPLSGIPKNTRSLRLALSEGPKWVGVFPPTTPEDRNRSSFRNVVFFGIQDDGKSPENFCEFSTLNIVLRTVSNRVVIVECCGQWIEIYLGESDLWSNRSTCPERPRKTTQNLSHNSWCPGRHSILSAPESKSKKKKKREIVTLKV